jgi:hypothetical protein
VVELMSLDAGAPLERSSTLFDDWKRDAAIETALGEWVSEQRSIVAPLPGGEGDVLVVVHTAAPLWLDSLTTE